GDPHFWVDPVSMRDVVLALATTLESVGVDVADRATDLAGRLDDLDAEVRDVLEAVPADGRKLVTGHESMGYFADRYDFRLIGAVIPGLTSQGEVSAGELATLKDEIDEEGVRAIFTEIGTPSAVVESIGSETGVQVVELPSHSLPEDGSYFTLIREIAGAIASALR
ncbi:MAG: metal ABC transporter substrate-binding protein, partial [Chloroflexota bacterium]